MHNSTTIAPANRMDPKLDVQQYYHSPLQTRRLPKTILYRPWGLRFCNKNFDVGCIIYSTYNYIYVCVIMCVIMCVWLYVYVCDVMWYDVMWYDLMWYVCR